MPSQPAPAARDAAGRNRRPRAGFTMAELLVMIGIILLVLVLALPAFTAIIGSRSVESARNVVASAIVRARGEAIRRGQPCGVFFYVDGETGRSGLAIVTLDPLTDPDPYDEYKSFTRSTDPPRDYQGGTYDPLPDAEDEPVMTSDRVVVLGSDANPLAYAAPRYSAFLGRPIVLTLKHTGDEIANNPGVTDPGDTTNVPAPSGGNTVVQPFSSTNKRSYENDHWAFEGVGVLEIIDGIEPNVLPSDAGIQVLLASSLDSDLGEDGAIDDTVSPSVFRERYARYGAILFDSHGRLVQVPYGISGGSRLARVIGVGPTNPGAPTSIPFGTGTLIFPTSQLGLVIYERESFASAPSDGTALAWKGNAIASLQQPTTVLDDFTTSEGDLAFPWRYFNTILASPQPVAADEYAEERWLDANTIPLMVNRYSGTLVEAE